MKLLLTSAGITNQSIENEMWRLLGGKHPGLRLLFCTTASNYKGGNMNAWLIRDIEIFKNLGFEIDICDLSGAPKSSFLPRFQAAKVLFFEGGSAQWLRKCIADSDLEPELPKLLESKLWIGASAGSIVLCPLIADPTQNLFGETIPGYPTEGMSLVDFQFIPHLNSPKFPNIREQNLKNALGGIKNTPTRTFYALDDQSAISIDNDKISIISEGHYLQATI